VLGLRRGCPQSLRPLRLHAASYARRSGAVPEGVPGLPPGRCFLRLRPDVRRSGRDRGRLLGSRAAEVLRVADLGAGTGARGLGPHPAALYGRARRQGVSSEGRFALRRKDAVPLLTAFGEWLTEQGARVLPKSPIGQAVAYAQSNWAALCRYPE